MRRRLYLVIRQDPAESADPIVATGDPAVVQAAVRAIIDLLAGDDDRPGVTALRLAEDE